MQTEGLKIRGDIVVRAINLATGEVCQRVEVRNAIMQNGVLAIAKLLTQNASAAAPGTFKVTRLAAGSGTLAANSSQTALQSPVASADYTLTDADRVITVGPPVVIKFTAQMDALAPGTTLTEAGLFLSDGTMFARQIHASVTAANGIVIDYEWRITLTA